MMPIRTATPDDRAATVALWAECGLTRPWNDPGLDFDRAVSGPTSAVLLAFGDDGSIAGSVMVGADGHRGWIYYLGVSVDDRGTGLGRILMQAVYDALEYESSDVVVRQKWLS